MLTASPRAASGDCRRGGQRFLRREMSHREGNGVDQLQVARAPCSAIPGSASGAHQRSVGVLLFPLQRLQSDSLQIVEATTVAIRAWKDEMRFRRRKQRVDLRDVRFADSGTKLELHPHRRGVGAHHAQCFGCCTSFAQLAAPVPHRGHFPVSRQPHRRTGVRTIQTEGGSTCNAIAISNAGEGHLSKGAE